MNIKEYIKTICRLLKIKAPKISDDVSKLMTKTMLAAYVSSEDTIYINLTAQSFDLLFAIAHELRHKWQLKTNEQLYMGNYKTTVQCKNLIEYNLQLAEVDANAFGKVVMNEMFGVNPLFQGMPRQVVKAVEEQAEKIICSL